MSLRTGVDAYEIPRINHDEAMLITAEENRRFRRLLDEIGPDQWERPTDCTRWRVRDVVVHVIAGAEGQSSPLELARQLRAGRRLTAEIGGVHWVDGLNEAGLRARADLRLQDLPQRFDTASAAALRARQRMLRPIRALPLIRFAPGVWKPLGYLYDIGFTRDVWMHRIDLYRATNQPYPADASHDGRIVADIIAEWATTHSDPFTLHLTGPAGGTYSRSSDARGETLQIDAIDCCRILSGRGTPVGVLHHPFPL
jgi:uncharacterized protein (TIGR03083 family)